jgi:hypothetical protein
MIENIPWAKVLNVIGIMLEGISLFLIFRFTPTKKEIEKEDDLALSGITYLPNFVETREGIMKLSVPLMFGLALQILATIIA